jgi:hypothetical protein
LEIDSQNYTTEPFSEGHRATRHDVKKPRMRTPNAIDFWRGVALVMIFINHVPGNVFSILTLRNYAISDAAELFVFLAGCSMAYAVGAPGRRKPTLQIVGRLLKRAFEIWQTQIVVISGAIALLGSCALALNDQLLLEWHNAGPAFFDTVRSSIGLVFLTYQIGYFNILPLYVVLLLMAPVLVLASLKNRLLAIALSFGLYAYTLTTQISLPSWPTDGAWHFNPFSWQVLILLGFISTDMLRTNPDFRALVERAWLPAAVVVAMGAGLALLDIRPDPLLVPEPRLFFLFDKAYLSPVRVINMLALAVVFFPTFALITSWSYRVTTATVSYMRCVGRNSLAVFGVSSLLALGGQIARYIGGSSVALDLLVVIAGLVLMRVTAWIAEFPASAQQR